MNRLGYGSDLPYSLGWHLRDAHSAAPTIIGDRILANSTNFVLGLRDGPGLLT